MAEKSAKRLFVCENDSCKEEFWREPNSISPHNYCSSSCAATVNNRKFPKRFAKIAICRSCNKSFKNLSHNKDYCSVACRSHARLKYTKDEIIRAIKNKSLELNRVPAKREIAEYCDTAIRLFGSWNEAVRAAGFEPYRSHDDRMYKRSRTKALDGHKCDSISEAIIDNWLYKQKIPHSRDIVYPKGNYKSDWSLKNGKVFVEYFGLAKDSPRYDASISAKNAICRNYGIKLVPIFAEDLYPKPIFTRKLQFLEKYKGLL